MKEGAELGFQILQRSKAFMDSLSLLLSSPGILCLTLCTEKPKLAMWWWEGLQWVFLWTVLDDH